MDFIHRKVFLSNDLIPYDSDSDGVNDTLIISKTDKIIQVPLTHRFNDMGLYDVYDDNTVTILDVVSVIDGNIDQSQIDQPVPSDDIIEINWDGGNTDKVGPGETTIDYCKDSTKSFYAVLTSDDNFQYLTYPNRLNGEGESTVVTYTKDIKFNVTDDENVCTGGGVTQLEVDELDLNTGQSDFGSFGGNSCNGDCIYYGQGGKDGKYLTFEGVVGIYTDIITSETCKGKIFINTPERCSNQEPNAINLSTNIITLENIVTSNPACTTRIIEFLGTLKDNLDNGERTIDLGVQRDIIVGYDDTVGCDTQCDKAYGAANQYCKETYGTITKADGSEEVSRVLKYSDFSDEEQRDKPWKIVNLMDTDRLYPGITQNNSYIEAGNEPLKTKALGICFHCLQNEQ